MSVKKVVEVEVQAKQAQKNLDDLTATLLEQKEITIEFKKELALLEKQLRDTPKNSLAAQKELKDRINNLKDAIKDQTLSIQELNLEKANQKANEVAVKGNEALGESLSKNRGFLSALNTLTGGVSNQILGFAKGIKSAVTSVKTLTTGMKGLKVALISTGIGVFAVALGAIVANWDSITKGVQRFINSSAGLTNFFNQVKAGFNSVFESIRPVLEFFGLYPTLEEEATEAARKGAEVRASQYEKELKLAQARGESAKELARIEEQLLQDKIAAAEKEEDIEAAKFELQLFYARERKRIRDEELSSILERDKLLKDQENLRRQQENEFIVDAEEAFQATRQKKKEDDLINFGDYNAALLEEEELFLEESLRLNEIGLENEKLIAEAKQAITDSNLNNAQSGFALLGQLAGKNKALQAAALIGESAAGIARTVINTQTSNASTIAQGAALAIPTAGASVAAASALVASNNISAGIGIATNIAATAKALGALKAGGAPKGGSVNGVRGGGSSVSIPSSQAPAFNVVGTSGTNQLAQSIAGQTQQPVKAYVVSNDVSTAQSLDRNIVEGASI